jgi:hypothetical protein
LVGHLEIVEAGRAIGVETEDEPFLPRTEP